MTNLVNVLRGFLMGSADVVPGVSGGTVALVLGIYERLVHNIRTGAAVLGAIIRGKPTDAKEHLGEIEWSFLVPLLVGIALAVVTLARVLEGLLEDHPRPMAGLFFGLVAGSIVIAIGLVSRWNPSLIATATAAAVAAFVVLGLRSGEVADPATLIFLGAGALAIVAMILPGISGSFILLMVGMYEAVLAAVNDRDLLVIGVFLIGAVIGLAAFSTLLDRLLRDHHDLVMAVLIGVMIGSLRVLWPWPDGTESARLEAPGDWGVPLALGLGGFVAIVVLGRASARFAKRP